MNDHLDLQVSIEEMRGVLKQQWDGMDAIKATARSVLSAASLIVALLGALQVLNARVDPAYQDLYHAGILVALGLYVLLVAGCSTALLPVTMKGPVMASWEVLQQAFSGKEEREILKMRLSGLLNAIALNTGPLRRMRALTTLALLLLPLEVVLLMLLGLIPRMP